MGYLDTPVDRTEEEIKPLIARISALGHGSGMHSNATHLGALESRSQNIVIVREPRHDFLSLSSPQPLLDTHMPCATPKFISDKPSWSSIPTEILIRIFKVGVRIDQSPDVRDDVYIPGGRRAVGERRLPVVVSCVCTSWRAAAFEAREIWGTICFGLPLYARRLEDDDSCESEPGDDSDEDCPPPSRSVYWEANCFLRKCANHQRLASELADREIDRCATFLRRSGNSPLSVYIVNPIIAKLDAFIALLKIHLHRLHHITIYLPNHPIVKTVEAIQNFHGALALESLRVGSMCDPDDPEPVPSISLPFSLPALRRIINTDFPAAIFSSIGRSLNDLYLDDVNYTTTLDFHNLLLNTPNLARLQVHLHTAGNLELKHVQYMRQTTVSLPWLKVLSIEMTHFPVFFFILGNIHVPSLEVLNVYVHSAGSAGPPSGFYVQRLPRLSHLIWRVEENLSPFSADAFRALVSSAPSVKRLDLIKERTTLVVDTLRGYDLARQGALAPQLKQLFVHEYDSSRISSFSSLARKLKQRLRSPIPVAAIHGVLLSRRHKFGLPDFGFFGDFGLDLHSMKVERESEDEKMIR